MEETRANLATKLEALESQVRETVSSASETVTTTVEGVKDVVDTVSDTVGSVTDTLNIGKHIEDNPWMALGIAVAAGFVAAQVFGGSGGQPARQEPAPQPPPSPPQPQPQSGQDQTHVQQQPTQGGILPSLESLLPDMNGALGVALSGVNSLAIGTVMGVVREVVANGLPPEWKTELSHLVDQVTTQLGGKPLQAVPRQDNEHHEEQRTEQKGDNTTPRQEDRPTEPEDKNNRRKRNNRNHVTNQI
jgi:ElaB/YqjD/DUF883 family membrane-anchored ribosome-binding protein